MHRALDFLSFTDLKWKCRCTEKSMSELRRTQILNEQDFRNLIKLFLLEKNKGVRFAL